MPSVAPTHRRPIYVLLAALVATLSALAVVLPAAAAAKPRGPALKISLRAPSTVASAASSGTCRVKIVRHRFRVRKVTFTVNGRRVGVDRHAPYTCRWRARSARPGRYTLRAKAQDVRGHAASARIRVVVTNQSQPAPAPYGASVGISASLRGRVHGDIAQTISRLRAAGVSYVREDFIWSWVQEQQGQWNWSDYDTVVGECAKQGLKIIAIPDGPPKWASGDAPPASGSALSGYTEFVTQAIARYGSNGTFWSQHPEIPKVAVTMWDVWNEPYFKVSWGGQMPDPGAYARMFKTVASAGRAVDSQAKFMLEAETGNGGVTTWPQPPYLGAMFDAVPDLGKYADYVSVHPYTSNDSPNTCTPESPSKGIGQDWKATRFQFCRVLDVRKILDGRGANNTRIWITEVGYTTAPQGSSAVSEATQAQYVHDIFRQLRQWKAVDGICWYHYQTDESSPSDDQAHFGLVHADGSPKPAWDAFVQEAHAGL